MLLSAIFTCQDQETVEFKTESSSLKQEDNLSNRKTGKMATLAMTWSQKHQGTPLSRLPLYSLTTSEVLRLHLLASGAPVNTQGAKWRYQQRGGYTNEDDPGLDLITNRPHILKSLGLHNVVQLAMNDKIQILTCLVNQLLTYADVRDIVEEEMEKSKQAKIEHRTIQINDRKTQQECLASKAKLRKQEGIDPEKLNKELALIETNAQRQRNDNEIKMKQLIQNACENQVVMGVDRCYRQYLRLESVPAFFINDEETNPGLCQNHVTVQEPNLVDADKTKTLAHLKSIAQGVSEDKKDIQNPGDLMMCSADPEICRVHSVKIDRQVWSFYDDVEQLDVLTAALNKRGLRESELLHNLTTIIKDIQDVIGKTPVKYLTSGIVEEERRISGRLKKNHYENANLGFPPETPPEEILHSALLENILEIEEKIHAGSLGMLPVKNREKWREALQNKNYKSLDTNLQSSRSSSPAESTASSDSEYQDPGIYLGTDLNVSQSDDDLLVLNQDEEIQESIRSLAVALVQVARGVQKKYLKKPLGMMGKNGYSKGGACLDQWERSLLAATSFSQVFLHYSTLDSCVMWSRSVLLARCRICRRHHDSENMLLCDNCNLGHHLYCVKPKLKVFLKITIFLFY